VPRSQAPPFHLAESRIRRGPGWLYKATGHRLPPISSMSCSFVILPSHGPAGVVRTVPLKLVRATANAMFDGDPVEAICLSPRARSTLFENCCRNAIGPTRLTHGTGPSRKLSNISCRHLTMVLPILVGMSGNVAAATHLTRFIPADVGNPEQRSRDRNHASHL
jgi:hypothetical protein